MTDAEWEEFFRALEEALRARAAKTRCSKEYKRRVEKLKELQDG